MRTPLLRLFLGFAALVLLASGCAKQAANLMAPAPHGSSSRAPLTLSAALRSAVPGAYIVVFKPDQATADVDGVVNELSTKHAFTAQFRYKYALRGFAAKLPPAAVEALRNDPRVAYIEQDQIAHAVATQVNPPSWGLDRIDQHPLPLDLSYTYNQTGAGVDAYCIDTGIRFTHVDFGGRAVTGVDEITPGGTAADGNGHGTHTAGTIGGSSYGVAKGIHLIAVRVLDNSGSGSYSQVIAGVDWVTADHTTHPAVANMSLGGPVSSALDASVRSSIADGVTYCVSAGNSAADVSTQSPAGVAEAITVGATDINDGFATFSNFGSGVDISGPGVDITSDWNTSDIATNTISGTSMSSPHVAGAAALYLQANPTATPAQVSAGLVTAATNGVITSLPAGTPNRLLYALIASGPPPPPPAAPVLSSPANGATGVSTSPALAWNASSGATSYRVQVSTSSSFVSTVYDQSGITSTTTNVTGLAAGTVYYWRVNATNAGGTSAFSTVFSFTTGAGSPPAAPTQVSPLNASSNVSRTPTLTWNTAAGASSYRVQVSTSSTFTTTVFDQAGITSTSVALPQLGSRTTYYWHVNATNANGTSAYSTIWSFRTSK